MTIVTMTSNPELDWPRKDLNTRSGTDLERERNKKELTNWTRFGAMIGEKITLAGQRKKKTGLKSKHIFVYARVS